jgi:hypothetical protein
MVLYIVDVVSFILYNLGLHDIILQDALSTPQWEGD